MEEILKRLGKMAHSKFSDALVTSIAYIEFLLLQKVLYSKKKSEETLKEMWENSLKYLLKKEVLKQKKSFLQKIQFCLHSSSKRKLTTEFISNQLYKNNFERNVIARLNQINLKYFDIDEKSIALPKNKDISKQWKKLRNILIKIVIIQQLPLIKQSRKVAELEKSAIKKMEEIHKLIMKDIHVFEYKPPHGG